MPPAIALVIADTLHQFLLLGVPLSPSEAKAGAVAAAEYLVRQPNIRQRIAQAGLIQNALARATTVAQAVPVGGVAQANIPLQMFAADDIEHIYHVVVPKLMVQFQMAMFRENNVYLYAHLIEHNEGLIHGRSMAPAIVSRKEQEGGTEAADTPDPCRCCRAAVQHLAVLLQP